MITCLICALAPLILVKLKMQDPSEKEPGKSILRFDAVHMLVAPLPRIKIYLSKGAVARFCECLEKSMVLGEFSGPLV